MHLARHLMGQTESKTCIGKGMKHPPRIRLLPIQNAESPKLLGYNMTVAV